MGPSDIARTQNFWAIPFDVIVFSVAAVIAIAVYVAYALMRDRIAKKNVPKHWPGRVSTILGWLSALSVRRLNRSTGPAAGQNASRRPDLIPDFWRSFQTGLTIFHRTSLKNRQTSSSTF